VLLDFSGSDCGALMQAAAACGMPMRIARIDNAEAGRLYATPLALVRPDGHVAWRGTEVRERDAARIIDTVRGAGSAVAARRAGEPH
jgi:hypothetical protein